MNKAIELDDSKSVLSEEEKTKEKITFKTQNKKKRIVYMLT